VKVPLLIPGKIWKFDKQHQATLLHWQNSGGRSARNQVQWIATVAQSNDALVGCMCLQCVEKVPSPEQHNRHWGYLTNAYVSQNYRNKGTGGKLLKALVQLGRERNLELIIVWPSVEAVSLYEHAGFRIASEMHQEPGDFPPMELVF